MKEMLGGCCVCSDERGWTENPLVYCDGQGCTVAVHQACYGIVTVPTGPWYCRKCESQERSARVRCELCPSRDGALKRTDQAGWAHVVCALYIPEVRFGNVTTMEPIILQLVPQERFHKMCYICEEQGRASKAIVGACMQCNKTGCRQQFHVTCAQTLGLLCEEAGNYLDNVKYCGYCQHHYSKLKKGGNVKTIPPYKPIPADNGSSGSSPEKEAEILMKTTSTGKRKTTNHKMNTSTSKNKSTPSPSVEVNGEERSGSGSNTPKDNTTSNSKFTTSNFVETIVTQSESVFGHENVSASGVPPPAAANKSNTSNSVQKTSGNAKINSTVTRSVNHASRKRRTGARTPTVANENSSQSTSSEMSGPIATGASDVEQPQIGSSNITLPSTETSSTCSVIEHENSKQTKADIAFPSNPLNTDVSVEAATTPVIMSISQSEASNVTHSSTANSIVVSVPLNVTSLPSTVQSVVPSSVPTLYQQLQQSMVSTEVTNVPQSSAGAAQDQPMKRSRSQSVDKQEKSRKPKRGSSNSQPASAISTTTVAAVSTVDTISTTTSKRSCRNTSQQSNQLTPNPPTPVSSIIQGPGGVVGHFSSVRSGSSNSGMGPTVKDSPPSSPGSESMSNAGPIRRKRKVAGNTPISSTPSTSTPLAVPNNTKEEKDIKLFQNGVSAPHMLGNQLNPTSTMAQKMSDTLSQELEAHSIFTESNNSGANLVGPQLHSRVIASVRSNQNTATSTASLSSVFSTNNTGTTSPGVMGGGAIPQTLEQLLERQWEQGSQFLMEQAQHFDIASLLSCLHQLRAENLRLEEHVNSLLQRRDHLLAVNARLAIPLTSQPSTLANNIHPSSSGPTGHPPTSGPAGHPSSAGPTGHPTSSNISSHSEVTSGGPVPISRTIREPRMNSTYMPHTSSSSHATSMENGLPPDPSPPSVASHPQYPHRGPSLVAPQPSPTIRHSQAGSGYHQGQSSNIISPLVSNSGVVRNTSVTPDPLRSVQRSVAQSTTSMASSMYPPQRFSFISGQASGARNPKSAYGLSPIDQLSKSN